MPKYVVHYFQVSGRAEVARLLFHHAGVEFEDHRFSKEEWQELKKDERRFPHAQAPTLEVDGEVLCESQAINRYLANEFGLFGKTNWERAKIDLVCEAFSDIFQQFLRCMKESDAERKAEFKKTFFEEQLPDGLRKIGDKFLSENGFLNGDSITLSDLSFFGFIKFLKEMFEAETNIDSVPKMKALYERIASTPNIKKYLDSQQKK